MAVAPVDPMYTLTGQAVVLWSRVEHTWALFFRDMLFDGVGDPPEIDEETRAPLPRKDDATRIARANAVFFNVGSGDTQRRLIESVAEVVLSSHAEFLGEVKALLKTSRILAKRRNAIIHAYYDMPVKFDGTAIQIGPYEVDDFGGAQAKPDFDYYAAIADFSQHGQDVSNIWLAFHGLA